MSGKQVIQDSGNVRAISAEEAARRLADTIDRARIRHSNTDKRKAGHSRLLSVKSKQIASDGKFTIAHLCRMSQSSLANPSAPMP